MRRARAAGLDMLALTDHDTLAGHDAARPALPAGLALVTGMELSARLDGHSVHMLTYLPKGAGPELAAECAAIVEDPARRARHMVDRLRELGVGITWPQVAAIAGDGRPPACRQGDGGRRGDPRPGQAFTPEWIGAGGRAYVSRYALAPARAIAVIASGGAAVLAHPARPPGAGGSDEAIAALAGAGLAGLEIDHPDQAPAERTARGWPPLGLVATGGSDDHGSLTGHRLGAETTSPAVRPADGRGGRSSPARQRVTGPRGETGAHGDVRTGLLAFRLRPPRLPAPGCAAARRCRAPLARCPRRQA